jgi:hypothetical protein
MLKPKCGTLANRASSLAFQTNQRLFRDPRNSTTRVNQTERNTLYIKIRYIVIRTLDDPQVTLTQVQTLHQTLNRAFGVGLHDTDDPNLTQNNFLNVLDTPGIQFLPATASVVYHEITEKLSSRFSPIAEVMVIVKPLADILNVYIGHNPAASDGVILGEAAGIGSSSIFIRYSTFDNAESVYGQGKTLIHEVGHAFGLKHIFDDSKYCNHSNDNFDDTPDQRLPNFCTTQRAAQGTSGKTWAVCVDNSQSVDNNDNCAVGTEMYPNYMDYSPDTFRTMFTQEQCTYMRNMLLSRHANLPTLVATPHNDGNNDAVPPNIVVDPGPLTTSPGDTTSSDSPSPVLRDVPRTSWVWWKTLLVILSTSIVTMSLLLYMMVEVRRHRTRRTIGDSPLHSSFSTKQVSSTTKQKDQKNVS